MRPQVSYASILLNDNHIEVSWVGTVIHILLSKLLYYKECYNNEDSWKVIIISKSHTCATWDAQMSNNFGKI